MTSPTRRRRRSDRVTAAVILLVFAAAAVAAAIVLFSPLGLAAAGVGAVVLGVLATRLTHRELSQSRIDAGRDRVEQARAYQQLADLRTEEHTRQTAFFQTRLAERQQAVGELEAALVEAQRRAADAVRQVGAAVRRAEQAEGDLEVLSRRVDQAEERAAAAVVGLAEVEQELDVRRAELDAVRAELSAWQDLVPAQQRA